MPISIRSAEVEDGAALLRHRQQLMEETSFMLFEPGELQKTTEDEQDRIKRLNSRSNAVVLVAVDGSEIVGNLTAVGGDVRRLRHSATLALGVSKSHWGKGVGAALLGKAVEWSEACGLTRLELTVHTTNHRALSLYLKAGFVVEGLRRRSLLLGEAYVDEYLMSRLSDA